MNDRESFLEWFNTTWHMAEDALHQGDPGPRSGTWSEREPVTLFGAWYNATDPTSARAVFQRLGAVGPDTSNQVGTVIKTLLNH